MLIINFDITRSIKEEEKHLFIIWWHQGISYSLTPDIEHWTLSIEFLNSQTHLRWLKRKFVYDFVIVKIRLDFWTQNSQYLNHWYKTFNVEHWTKTKFGYNSSLCFWHQVVFKSFLCCRDHLSLWHPERHEEPEEKTNLIEFIPLKMALKIISSNLTR